VPEKIAVAVELAVLLGILVHYGLNGYVASSTLDVGLGLVAISATALLLGAWLQPTTIDGA
jgi:hypothetical protein